MSTHYLNPINYILRFEALCLLHEDKPYWTHNPTEHKLDSYIWQVLLEKMAKWGTAERPMALNTQLAQILALILFGFSFIMCEMRIVLLIS